MIIPADKRAACPLFMVQLPAGSDVSRFQYENIDLIPLTAHNVSGVKVLVIPPKNYLHVALCQMYCVPLNLGMFQEGPNLTSATL